MEPRLIFVYNADSGRWSGYLDIAHKIVSPSTYPCSLCDLSYGIFKVRPQWQAFIDDISVSTEFLHKNEWLAAYPHMGHLELPAILLLEDDTLRPIIDAATLDSMQDVSELILHVQKIVDDL